MDRNRIAARLAAAFALACCVPAAAQNERLETIEVVGSRISYHDLLDTPAISLTRPGDYLLQPFTITNDTRSEDGRKQEIYATIEKMLAAAGKRYSIMQSGDFALELNAQNYRVPLQKEGKRPDVNSVQLSVRAPTGGDPKRAEEIIAALREFVAKAERVGRTEIDVAQDTALSLTRPERFRYELIKVIADDTSRLRGALGTNCKIELQGLNSRIEWRRVSASELLLYIPYTLTINDCGSG